MHCLGLYILYSESDRSSDAQTSAHARSEPRVSLLPTVPVRRWSRRQRTANARPIIAVTVVRTPDGAARRELNSPRGVVLWPRTELKSALGVVLCPRAGLKSAIGVVLSARLRRCCPTAVRYRASVKVPLPPVSPARQYKCTTVSVFLRLVRVNVTLPCVASTRQI